MGDAAVEAGKQGGSFGGDDGGFEVGAGKVADGVEGAPAGFDEYFDFAFEVAKRNGGSEVAGDAAELRYNEGREMFKIFGQLRFGGAGGPAKRNCPNIL